MSNRTYFEDKRYLPQQRLKDTFFDYLLGRILDIAARVWGGQRGVFGTLSLVSGGNDKFSVQTLPADLLDGDGNILPLAGTDGTGIQFENAAAATYYVAARHCLVPTGVLRNQRNNVIFYDTEEDRIGEVADPTSVAEVGGVLEIVVDSVFETSVSHAGRLVTVWLRRPLTTQEAVAIERDLVVAYVGGVNKVTTAALLGQAGGGASTDPADYQVCAQGVTVRKSDLSVVSPYAYLGTVTGAGAGNPPAGFSTLGQIDVSDGINPDLQEAYTAGRTIAPSGTYGGAVKIASADAGDELNALLHLDRKGATENTPVDLANVMDSNGVGQLNLYPMSHTTFLQEDETATVNGSLDGRLDLTRGGVNVGGGKVRRDCDFVLLAGFATAAVNGLYKLASPPGTTTIYLTRLDNGSMAGYWAGANGQTGIASFLRLGVGVARMPLGAGTEMQFGNPLVINGVNDRLDASPAVRLYARQSAAALEVFEGDALFPRKQFSLTKTAIPQAETTGPTGDEGNALLRLSRFGNTDWMQFMLVEEAGDVSAVPVAILQSLRPTGGTVGETEPVTLSGDIITFTGGGVDLTDADLRLNKKLNVIWLFNAADEADNGMYVILSFTTNTVTVRQLQGGIFSFAGASATARILAPRYVMANSYPHTNLFSDETIKWWTGFTEVLRDGEGNAVRKRIIPDGTYGNLVEYFDSENPPGYWARFELGAPGTTEGVFEFNRRATFKEQFDNEHCVLIEGGGAGGATLPTDVIPVSLAVKSFLGGPTANEFQIGMMDGTIVRPPGFRDDFNYQDWNSKSLNPKFYDAGADGVGDVWVSWGDQGVILQTSTTVSDMAWLMGPRNMNADTAKDWNWRFNAIVALGQFDNAASMIQIGLRNNLFPSGNFEFYFQRMAAVSGGNWEFKGWDGGGGFAVNTGISCVAGEWYYLSIVILSSNTVLYYVGRIGYNSSPNAMSNYGSRSMSSMAGESSFYFPELRVRTDEGFTKTLYCAYWEWWNGEMPINMIASLPPDSPV